MKAAENNEFLNSEADALSSCAMGAYARIILNRCEKASMN